MSTNKFYDSLKLDKKGTMLARSIKSEAFAPNLRLTLKKQLIELREEKSNYDYLFSKLNSLQHKFKLLEDEFAKNKHSFEKRQEESDRLLDKTNAEILELKKRTEAKEREFNELKDNYEKMIMKVYGYENQIKENVQLKATEESKASREKEEMEEVVIRKQENEEERKILAKKLEQIEEEIDEIDNQIKYYRSVEGDVNEKISQLLLEIKTSENKRESLELNVEKLKDTLDAKFVEKDEIVAKLETNEKVFENCVAVNKASRDRIRKLEKENADLERKQAESEVKIMCVEKMKAEVLKERNAKDNEIIQQAKNLKQLDFDIENCDNDLRTTQETYENLCRFQEKILKCLSNFEEENSAIHRLVSNNDELADAISVFTNKIEEAKKCLIDL
jgi:chromosome segregation ATPase